MKIQYEANGWWKFAEEDIFSDGCQPGGYTSDGDDRFKADTIPDLVKKLKGFVGCDCEEDVLLDSCEEDGRLDIQVMECEDGTTASPMEIEEWKAGKRRLWLVCYSFHIERVQREAVKLTAAIKAA